MMVHKSLISGKKPFSPLLLAKTMPFQLKMPNTATATSAATSAATAAAAAATFSSQTRPLVVVLVLSLLLLLLTTPADAFGTCRSSFRCRNGGQERYGQSIFGPCRCRCPRGYTGPRCQYREVLRKRSSSLNILNDFLETRLAAQRQREQEERERQQQLQEEEAFISADHDDDNYNNNDDDEEDSFLGRRRRRRSGEGLLSLSSLLFTRR